MEQDAFWHIADPAIRDFQTYCQPPMQNTVVQCPFALQLLGRQSGLQISRQTVTSDHQPDQRRFVQRQVIIKQQAGDSFNAAAICHQHGDGAGDFFDVATPHRSCRSHIEKGLPPCAWVADQASPLAAWHLYPRTSDQPIVAGRTATKCGSAAGPRPSHTVKAQNQSRINYSCFAQAWSPTFPPHKSFCTAKVALRPKPVANRTDTSFNSS